MCSLLASVVFPLLSRLLLLQCFPWWPSVSPHFKTVRHSTLHRPSLVPPAFSEKTPSPVIKKPGQKRLRTLDPIASHERDDSWATEISDGGFASAQEC